MEQFNFKTVNSELWTIIYFHINDSKTIGRDHFCCLSSFVCFVLSSLFCNKDFPCNWPGTCWVAQVGLQIGILLSLPSKYLINICTQKLVKLYVHLRQICHFYCFSEISLRFFRGLHSREKSTEMHKFMRKTPKLYYRRTLCFLTSIACYLE